MSNTSTTRVTQTQRTGYDRKLEITSPSIMSQPIYLSIHVTIYSYSCVSVLLVITADEGPRTETFCNIVSICYDKLIKLPKLLLHVAMSIYEKLQMLLYYAKIMR